MSPLFLYNNKLLVRDGKLATDQNCCCCPYTTWVGTMSADNAYAYYIGKANGANLRLIGGSFGPNSWRDAEIYTETYTCDEYPYILAWDWGAIYMIIAKFTLNNILKVVTNIANWECKNTAIPGLDQNTVVAPAVGVVQPVIAAGGWQAIGIQAPFNSALPQPTIWRTAVGGNLSGEGLDNANFIWITNFGTSPGPAYPYPVLFRTKLPLYSYR